jgi:aerobic-type carbon monoxide dehydrogenase small subunit (CoxS/CutS family)
LHFLDRRSAPSSKEGLEGLFNLRPFYHSAFVRWLQVSYGTFGLYSKFDRPFKLLKMRQKQLLRLKINGEAREVAAYGTRTLLEVLREDLGLAGTKHGCEVGECGTCAVLLDGQPALSCLLLPSELEGHNITTIEGLAQDGQLDPLQTAFADLGAAQCGYCTPGILLVAKALLAENHQPSRSQIEEALGGNLCRCTGYLKIFEAIELAASNPAKNR